MPNPVTNQHVDPSGFTLPEIEPRPVRRGQDPIPLAKRRPSNGVTNRSQGCTTIDPPTDFNRNLAESNQAQVSGAFHLICETDATFLLKDRSGSPAGHLVDLLELFGLRVLMRRLPGCQLGMLDLRNGLVVADPAKQTHLELNLTLAHELGHWRLHRNLLERGLQLQPIHEAQAETYAETFLLPKFLFDKDWCCRKLLGCHARSVCAEFLTRSVAKRYRVPGSTVARRVAKLSAVAPNRKEI